MNNFKYAISLAQTLYDVTGDQDDLEEIGLVAYNHIGNKNTQLVRALAKVIDGKIQLPCDVGIIEAITYCGPEEWNHVTNTHEFGDRNSFIIENYIEGTKLFKDPYYLSGKFVKYKRAGDNIYVDFPKGIVRILYHRELLDSEGLPSINDKEANAIAAYIAYTLKYKEALKTNNSNVFQIAQNLKQQWLFYCDAARSAEYISQNEVDQILNSMYSFDRKTYGRSFKPIK